MYPELASILSMVIPWTEIIVGLVIFFVGFHVSWVLSTNKNIQSNKSDIALLKEQATSGLELVTQKLDSSIDTLNTNLERFEKSGEWMVKTLHEHEKEIIILKAAQLHD